MGYLTAESILSADDFVYADVDCPEWGGMVRVRSLSGGQRSIITQRVKDNGTEDIEELLVVMGCVNAEGNRIFTNKDMDVLKKKSNTPISRIAKKIMEISGITDGASAVEDAKKNSSLTQKDDSSFD